MGRWDLLTIFGQSKWRGQLCVRELILIALSRNYWNRRQPIYRLILLEPYFTRFYLVSHVPVSVGQT